MGVNKKVPIVYFSGSGSTKMVAEVIAEYLSGSEIEPVMLEVSQKLTPQEVALCDFFVVATPTYNARPSQLLLDFIDKLPPVHHKKLRILLLHTAFIRSIANVLLGSIYCGGEFVQLALVVFEGPRLMVLCFFRVGFRLCLIMKSGHLKKYMPWLKI